MSSLQATFLAISVTSHRPKMPMKKMTTKIAALTIAQQYMKVPYELKKGQSRLFHQLPSGLNMEVILQRGIGTKVLDNYQDEGEEISGSSVSDFPPLVFVHGSYHAAWCWAENWLPFFSSRGYDCYALSLLGQGESDAPASSVAGTLETHASDIADFIFHKLRQSPVLVGHSFGGLIVQQYISNLGSSQLSETENLYQKLGGAVLVCSVPPSGNSGLVWRYIFSKPIAALKVTYSLAAKAFQNSLVICKETFFSASIEDHLVQRYQAYMKESSRVPLFDLRKLNASLPVPSVSNCPIEVLVLGANDDFIVDSQGLAETGIFYGVSPVCVEGVAHDMMLDSSWEKGAEVILAWVEGLP